MSAIASQLGEIQQRVSDACLRAGRTASDVRLIAVSKTFPVEDIREAVKAGHVDVKRNQIRLDCIDNLNCRRAFGSISNDSHTWNVRQCITQ